MKKNAIIWMILFLMAGVLIFYLPVSYRIDRTLEGIAIYSDGSAETVACTVEISGVFKNYMAGDNSYKGTVLINGCQAGEGELTFVFSEKTAAADFDGGCVRITPDCRRAIITCNIDSETGKLTENHEYECTVYVPADSREAADELVESFEWQQLQ